MLLPIPSRTPKPIEIYGEWEQLTIIIDIISLSLCLSFSFSYFRRYLSSYLRWMFWFWHSTHGEKKARKYLTWVSGWTCKVPNEATTATHTHIILFAHNKSHGFWERCVSVRWSWAKFPYSAHQPASASADLMPDEISLDIMPEGVVNAKLTFFGEESKTLWNVNFFLILIHC